MHKMATFSTYYDIFHESFGILNSSAFIFCKLGLEFTKATKAIYRFSVCEHRLSLLFNRLSLLFNRLPLLFNRLPLLFNSDCVLFEDSRNTILYNCQMGEILLLIYNYIFAIYAKTYLVWVYLRKAQSCKKIISQTLKASFNIIKNLMQI